MISYDSFKNVWNRSILVRRRLKSSINNTLPTVIYKDTSHYKHGSKEQKSGRIIQGVFFKYFDEWIWSWLNSINTNYTSIYHIIEFICNKENVDLKDLDFSSGRLDNTLLFIEENIEKHKQEIFTSGSSVFRKMFFATQLTWTKGCISTIVSLHRISKSHKIDCNLDFERGNEEDMTKGVDFKMFFSGETRNTQHKSAKLNDNETYFTSKSLLYNESIYRNHVDVISIQSGNDIYLFENSNNTNLIGVRNEEFFVYKTLIIDHMILDDETKELENLFIKINQICYDKNYIFMFETDESGKNKFDIIDENGIKTIRCFINDVNDKNLLSLIRENLDNLQ